MVGVSWRRVLSDDEVAEVLALLAAVADADGVPAVSEAGVLRVRPCDEQAEHLLARDDRGRLAGYAQLAAGTGELAVHPQHRRRGVGTRAVQALVDRAAGGPLTVWAHGEHPGALRLAQRFGFVRTRTLWQLRRSLAEPLDGPGLPDGAGLPDGVLLRPFVVGQDEQAFVEVNNRAFAWHPEQGGWGVEHVRQRQAQPWFDPAGFLLAVDETTGRLLGYHWTKVHGPELGEVYVLGVDPAEHGRGLGSALTLAGLRHLRDRGVRTVMLYVESDNTAAVRTYQRLGFTHWGTDLAYTLGDG